MVTEYKNCSKGKAAMAISIVCALYSAIVGFLSLGIAIYHRLNEDVFYNLNAVYLLSMIILIFIYFPIFAVVFINKVNAAPEGEGFSRICALASRTCFSDIIGVLGLLLFFIGAIAALFYGHPEQTTEGYQLVSNHGRTVVATTETTVKNVLLVRGMSTSGIFFVLSSLLLTFRKVWVTPVSFFAGDSSCQIPLREQLQPIAVSSKQKTKPDNVRVDIQEMGNTVSLTLPPLGFNIETRILFAAARFFSLMLVIYLIGYWATYKDENSSRLIMVTAYIMIMNAPLIIYSYLLRGIVRRKDRLIISDDIIELVRRGFLGNKHTKIFMDDLVSLDIEPLMSEDRSVFARFSGKVLYARTRDRKIVFGAGLDNTELEWLCDALKQFIMSEVKSCE